MDLTGSIISTRADQPPGTVAQCICFGRSLALLRQLCADDLANVQGVCTQTGCGSKCGLCVPYIQAAIKCKADVLDVMWSQDFRKLSIMPGKIMAIEKQQRTQNAEPAAGMFIDSTPPAQTRQSA
jgi:bacterioferritin-associated ferredoxin